MASFGTRLTNAIVQRGRVLVGVDPHPELLAAWGLEDNPTGLRQFCLRVIEATTGQALGVKPQSAFFERHGAAGMTVLEEVLASAAAAELITVLDAKRGDIGSTMAGYAQAYLGPNAPLAADALTVSPYLGFGSLKPAIDLALANGRGLFVLALTSNPEGRDLQQATTASGLSVAASIARQAAQCNANHQPLGSVGLVVGATIGRDAETAGVELLEVNGPLLAPGFGAQGADVDDVRAVFGHAVDRVIVPASRSILVAGPKVPDLASAISRMNATLAF